MGAEEEVEPDCHVGDDIGNSGADEDLFDLICESDEVREKFFEMEERKGQTVVWKRMMEETERPLTLIKSFRSRARLSFGATAL